MTSLIPALRRNSLLRRPDFTLFDHVFDDIHFSNFFGENKEWLPNVDLSETDTEFVVRAEVPGIDKKDIDVTLTDGLLTIKGEKKHEKEEKEKNYHRVESHYGAFSRTFKLPGEVLINKIEASYKDGVLMVTVPKTEKTEPKKILVN